MNFLTYIHSSEDIYQILSMFSIILDLLESFTEFNYIHVQSFSFFHGFFNKINQAEKNFKKYYKIRKYFDITIQINFVWPRNEGFVYSSSLNPHQIISKGSASEYLVWPPSSFSFIKMKFDKGKGRCDIILGFETQDTSIT